MDGPGQQCCGRFESVRSAANRRPYHPAMPIPAARGDEEWTELTVVQESGHAGAVMDLLREARVPCRLVRVGGHPARDDEAAPVGSVSFRILVAARELPVAAGVVDHFLAAFRHEAEGDADHAQVLAALSEPDPELAGALEREHQRAQRWKVRAALGVALAVALAVLGALLDLLLG